MPETGDLVRSFDPRDDSTQLFVVVETDIPTTSGMACKVRPVVEPLAVYRLDRYLGLIEDDLDDAARRQA